MEPQTIAAVVERASRRDGIAVRFPRDGVWQEWRYRELGDRARRLAAGLLTVGVQPGDRVAVLAETRPEWTLVDCALACAGATVVPIYHSNSPAECAHVLRHSGARFVICADTAQRAKVDAVRAQCPKLEHIVLIDGEGDGTLDALERAGGDLAAVERIVAGVRPDDVATIVYTSGSTGPPKGCVLTHANLVQTMRAYEQALALGDDAVVFLFLPLAHVLARLTQLVGLDVGATLAYWGGDARHVLDELAVARPTHVPSVPRVFEKIHSRALATRDASGPLRQGIFDRAIATGLAFRSARRAGDVRPLLAARHALVDRLVLRRIRDLFGGELRLALTGAAPIAPQILRFFDACGVLVLEGYGLTETSAAATLNTPEGFRFGTVGRPLPGMDVRIAGDGEILLRGPNVFAGYLDDADATAQALQDGWFYSGDLGELDGDGFLRITGRKKELIITSSGKNVAPQPIEAALQEIPWVSRAVVYGDGHPYVVALLTLDQDEARALAEELGIEAGIASMATDPRVMARLDDEVAVINRRFARIEQVKRFVVLDHDLSHDAGELTPTEKVKRGVVYDRYGQVLEGLYAKSGDVQLAMSPRSSA